MSEEKPRRSGLGAVFTGVVVGGSAIGVVGWYLLTNRAAPAIDASGFDLSAAPRSRAPAPAPLERTTSAQPSRLSMLKGDAGVTIGVTGSASAGQAAPAGKELDKKEQSHADFTQEARKHEADVRRFAEKMTRKYPIFHQYARDWMSHPDLKKLNDDYMRNHDPVAFIMGLTKAPSLGGMVKKYAGSPAVMAFITDGMKEAPGELTSSAMDVLANDSVAKSLIANVATGLGLPASVSGLINSTGADAKTIDQKQVVNDVMNSDAVRNAMPQGQQAPPPVSLSNQP